MADTYKTMIQAANIYPDGHLDEKGVTIIELIIATAIFSVVLLIVLYGFFYLTSVYIKGYVQSNTQETAVDIENQVTMDLELSNGGVGSVYKLETASDGISQGVCIGDNRYSFDLNEEYPDNTYYGLMVDTVSGCNGLTAAQSVTKLNPNETGEELLGEHMRLGAFSVTPVSGQSGLYNVDITVAYGSDSAFSSISSSAPYSYYCAPLSLGNNFCAVSPLQMVVQQQVTGAQ
jgi:prepilin-type N-terminal cleavage/methylation domain-containing protein